MAEPDWGSGAIVHDMHAVLVDPLNLETVRGELDGLQPSGTWTMDRAGDTRQGLTLTTQVPKGQTDGWDGSAAIRVYHDVGAWSECVFTGYVTEHKTSDSAGMRQTDYTLNSTLYGLSVDLINLPYTVATGASAIEAIEHVLKICNRPYRIGDNATSFLIDSPTVYEPGKSYLSIVTDLSTHAGNRLDVLPDGRVYISDLVPYASQAPAWYVDTEQPDTMVLDGVDGSDTKLTTPSRVIVHAKKDDVELAACAYQGDESEFSRYRRGYNLDSYHDETQLEPFTQEKAQQLANQYLAEESQFDRTVSLKTLYFPARAPQVVRLMHTSEYDGNYVIDKCEVDLATWHMSMSLLGVAHVT